MNLAIKRAGEWWRVYEVVQADDRFPPYAKVLRDEQGRIRNFHSEENAREFIGSIPDATEVEYPE